VKDHSKLSANRNFVVEIAHFEVKRRKNYRIRGSKPLAFLYIRFFVRKCEGSQQTKCESEFRRGTCTFRSKTTQELQNSRFQAANFPLNKFFSHASVNDHSKLSANRNFVVELVHFEVKRRKNYRIPGSKPLTLI
jgi:hypothetical protein